MIKKNCYSFFAGLMALVLFSFIFVNEPIKADAMTNVDLQMYKAVFDATYYYSAYPEVAAYYGPNYMALLTHFITTGAKEGKSASASFNPSYYKETYPDLAAIFGDDLTAYVRHYVTKGYAEGRIGNTKEAANVKLANIAIKPTTPVVVTEYTTTYDAKIPRAKNVQLASASLNGVIVMPGETFSYTNTVGPRTLERGFVVAPVYNNGEVAKGVGGGICQVSSTLYAAMKKVGIPATERHQHSLPVHYVPSGWDATISGTTLDLKFKNIYPYPMYIESIAVDGVLTVRIYFLK